jgi:polyhydroxyalkanoate synthesis regulator phasin
MKRLDKILDNVKNGEMNTAEAKQHVLDLFVVMCSVCKTPINLKENIVITKDKLKKYGRN